MLIENHRKARARNVRKKQPAQEVLYTLHTSKYLKTKTRQGCLSFAVMSSNTQQRSVVYTTESNTVLFRYRCATSWLMLLCFQLLQVDLNIYRQEHPQYSCQNPFSLGDKRNASLTTRPPLFEPNSFKRYTLQAGGNAPAVPAYVSMRRNSVFGGNFLCFVLITN